MRPSFFTLFKRGRYYRPAPISTAISMQGAGFSRTTKEAERFAAAALAFAWKHDPAFKLHMWNTVCRFHGDPPLSKDAEIFIEPERWADLMVVNPVRKRRVVYAIECKIAAGLQAPQNPVTRAFGCRDGYGALLTNSSGALNTTYRFILLGFPKTLNLQTCRWQLPLKVQQRFWEDFATGIPQTAFARDLGLSLGQLGIGAFPASETNGMKVNLNSSDLGHAIRVIAEVQRRLDWDGDRKAKRAFDVTEDDWSIGVDLYSGSSGNPLALKSLVTPPRRWLAWFGYEGQPETNAKLGVWLYCSSRARQEKVAARLGLSFSNRWVEVMPRDGRYFSVAVRARPNRSTDDVSWFCSVFRALGLKLRS